MKQQLTTESQRPTVSPNTEGCVRSLQVAIPLQVRTLYLVFDNAIQSRHDDTESKSRLTLYFWRRNRKLKRYLLYVHAGRNQDQMVPRVGKTT